MFSRKLNLFDVEGTITESGFFNKVLLPYAQLHLEDFLIHHHQDDEIQKALSELKRIFIKKGNQVTNDENLLRTIQKLIRQKNHPLALEEILGHVWDIGFSKNDFKSHIYPDVLPFFRRILESSGEVALFSSYPTHIQKLILSYSDQGDLTPFISYYFDSHIGEMNERTSYSNIANSVHLKLGEIHFFSKNLEALQAAQNAGMEVTFIQRQASVESTRKSIKNFRQFSGFD